MEEKTIFVDGNGHQWQMGLRSVPTLTAVTKGAKWVILPFIVDAMYPVDDSLSEQYSNCALCGTSIERGLIVIEFIQNAWGVRIGCIHHTMRGCQMSPVLICNVFDILNPIITCGWNTPYKGCTVCDRFNCVDLRCKAIVKSGILAMTDLDSMFEHFYRIRLDILSPLVPNGVCSFCSKETNRICRVCRCAVYCNYGCKQKDGHKCESFVEMWRIVQF